MALDIFRLAVETPSALPGERKTELLSHGALVPLISGLLALAKVV